MLQPNELQLPTPLARNVLEIAAISRRQHDAFDAGALRSDDLFLHAADRKHEAAQACQTSEAGNQSTDLALLVRRQRPLATESCAPGRWVGAPKPGALRVIRALPPVASQFESMISKWLQARRTNSPAIPLAFPTRCLLKKLRYVPSDHPGHTRLTVSAENGWANLPERTAA